MKISTMIWLDTDKLFRVTTDQLMLASRPAEMKGNVSPRRLLSPQEPERQLIILGTNDSLSRWWLLAS